MDEGDLIFDYFLRPIRGFESHENILDYMTDRSIEPDEQHRETCRMYETEKLRHLIP